MFVPIHVSIWTKVEVGKGIRGGDTENLEICTLCLYASV